MIISLAVLVVRVSLAIVFFFAGIAKLADFAGARKAMRDFGAPEFLRKPLARLIPIAELVCAVALLVRSWMVWGAAGILLMLAIFTTVILISLARGIRPDCHCFGEARPSQIGGHTVARNVFLALMAVLVIWQGPDSMTASGVWSDFAHVETPLTQLGIAVFGLVFLMLWLMIHLLRQNGRLLLRVEELEKRVPKPEAPPPGLPVNTPAPEFRLAGLDGKMVAFQELRERAPSLMLVFVEPGCGVCDLLLPDVARWQKENQDQLAIVPISRGALQENIEKAGKHGVRDTLLQVKREVIEAYKVNGTPSAVLIKDGKVSLPLAEGVDDIVALHARAALPPPLKKGDTIPSIVFPDLSGKAVDLSRLRGKRHLIVFWSPTCGFCHSSLQDLKNVERNPPPGSPELIVISSGDRDQVRDLGFMSQVLMDNHFLAGTLFGSGGTPSGVVIDEEGKVASEVGMGGRGLFELAGSVPYVATKEELVDVMLSMAAVKSTDVVYDLGCGDGRIVVTAAKKIGTRGVGVDINPDRIKEAKANARKAGVEDLVHFEVNTITDVDFKDATVVCLYLLPNAMKKVQPRIHELLKPGARVVSHDYEFEGWIPDRVEKMDSHKLLLYTLPPK